MVEWSDMQRAVFDDVRDGTGHTCVEALAGTGKSTTLVEALKHVPKSRAASILVTSFSTSCVADLKAKKPPWMVDVRNYNSLGYRTLRDNGYELELDEERAWKVLDEVFPAPKAMSGDNARGFRAVRQAAKSLVDLARTHLADDAEGLYELCDEYGIVDDTPDWLAPALQDRFGVESGGELLGIVFSVLEKMQDTSDGTCDYNDQLWLPIVLDLPFTKYDRVFDDEAQDESPVQSEMLYRSLAKGARVCMFGDQHQAIFGWRGAGMGMDPFANRLKAKRLPLTVSYRCPRAVVELARRIVPEIESAPGAVEGLAESVDHDEMLQSIRGGDVVLSRSNAPLVRLFLALVAKNKPVGMKGADIGKTLASLTAKMGAKSVGEFQAKTEEWAAAEIARRRRKDPEAKVDSVTDRLECVKALCENSTSMSDVYAKIDRLFSAPPGHKILLSSVHRAKGLEWDRVFALDYTFPINPSFWMMRGSKSEVWAGKMADRCFTKEPEERNVYYVAVTRAKREIYLVGAPS